MKVSNGHLLEAIKASLNVAPFKKLALASGAGLSILCLYLKVYVPWRHDR
jgi:hypothetical protein